MKRRIVVTSPGITIIAMIDTAAMGMTWLKKDDLDVIRGALGSRLQDAAAHLPYIQTPRCDVIVKS